MHAEISAALTPSVQRERRPAVTRPTARKPPRAAADIDLASAIERLGGNAEVYRSLFPVLRRDASSLLALATSLAQEQLRPEAGIMFRSLRGIADALGAAALSRLAAQGEALMRASPSGKDARLLERINLVLVRSSIELERALRTWDGSAPAPGKEPQDRTGDPHLRREPGVAPSITAPATCPAFRQAAPVPAAW